MTSIQIKCCYVFHSLPHKHLDLSTLRMAMWDSEGGVSIVSTQEQLDTVWKLGQPSHILFVIGLDPNPRVSFNYWDSLKDSLLECSDLDALYGQNNFVVDVRRWLGPPRDDYLDVGMTSSDQTVSEQLWYDYPFHMETIVDACAQDLNSGFFHSNRMQKLIAQVSCCSIRCGQESSHGK